MPKTRAPISINLQRQHDRRSRGSTNESLRPRVCCCRAPWPRTQASVLCTATVAPSAHLDQVQRMRAARGSARREPPEIPPRHPLLRHGSSPDAAILPPFLPSFLRCPPSSRRPHAVLPLPVAAGRELRAARGLLGSNPVTAHAFLSERPGRTLGSRSVARTHAT